MNTEYRTKVTFFKRKSLPIYPEEIQTCNLSVSVQFCQKILRPVVNISSSKYV